ncbi:MAG TPA: glycine cleavage T C-terminal barrel domain-containing protein [Acidimicrobiales bacterium]|nr:glycine cleavage T C-terminal barrel domain-containing protein [Acidimicrobiales bacterium]
MSDLPDLRTTLGAAPIVRDVVRVHGSEAVAFLQGQLSQDVESLPVGEARPSLLLQPTGKVDAWVRVTREAEDALLVDVEQGYGELVLARLRRFKLRTKAELEPTTWSGLALRGPGAREVDVPVGAWGLDAHWPGVPSVDLLTAGELALAGVALVPEAAMEGLRIECGVPAMGAELTDATIPAEAGQWLIDASVSFTKGCYTGQELVARVDSRGGNVPRPIRGLLIGAPGVPRGAQVLTDDGATDVGHVTSVGESPALGSVALAVVSRTVEPGAPVVLRWPDGEAPARVAALPLR